MRDAAAAPEMMRSLYIVSEYTCKYIRVWVGACVKVRVCLSISVTACICMYVFTYVRICYACMFECIRVACMCACMCVRTYKLVRIFLGTHVYTYVYYEHWAYVHVQCTSLGVIDVREHRVLAEVPLAAEIHSTALRIYSATPTILHLEWTCRDCSDSKKIATIQKPVILTFAQQRLQQRQRQQLQRHQQ